MSNPLTQESEFSERRKHALQSANLIQDLKQRVSQLVERYYQHTQSSSENSVKLLSMLLEELRELAAKAVASVARDIEDGGGSLLPALRNDPNQLLLSAIEELNTADLEDFVSENFCDEEYDSIREVYKIMRKTIKHLKRQAKLSPDEVTKKFSEGKERYCIDHEQSLAFFREECGNQKDDREMLNDRYQDNRAVQIWRNNDMNICQTISEMEKAGCEESELSDLFAYIVRMEILHEITNTTRCLSTTAAASASPSDEKVKEALNGMLDRINCSRHWICIYRALVQVNIIKNGDYKAFESYIIKLIGKPKTPINLKDMTYKVDVDCFALNDIDDWSEEKSSVKGKTFKTYLDLAKDFLDKITQ